MSQSLYSVSLYDTLGPTAIEYIVNHASLVCIAASLPHIPTLLKLKPRLPSLRIIISLDPLHAGEPVGHSKLDLLTALAADAGLQIFSMEQVEALGESLGPVQHRPPVPSDIITLNYTSGTTGPPKGVILTHRAAVAAATSNLATAGTTNKDIAISYLPLAHIYERMMEHAALWAGAAIGFFHGDILNLVDDLKVLRPTQFPSVPRLYNRFGGAIRSATTSKPGFTGALSRHVVSTKLASLRDPDAPNATNKHAIYDRVWGRKVASALGLERTRTMVSGSAPLDPSLHQFLRVVLGNHFLQGYGLTETYAVGLGQLDGDLSVGNCGAVAPCDELCLASVPDMEYYATDKPFPRGELLVRGNTLFSGYFRDEEETAKALLPDGWFRTGDICTVDERGRFKIIDRRKNVLKLAQGEYISPERIENVYLANMTYLSQAYVHGDSMQTFLVAIFGVLPETFAPFASNVLGQKIEMTDLEAIQAACKDERIRKAVCKDLDRVGKKNKFAGYEKVKNCYLYLDPFTIDNELLTPTYVFSSRLPFHSHDASVALYVLMFGCLRLKLKRPLAAKKFRTDLDQLYAEALAEEERSLKARL